MLAGALVIGAALGLLGGGGTILTVPLLRGLLGVATPEAVAMSLPIMAVASAAGATVSWWSGAFAVTPALGLAAATGLGAYAGAGVARSLSAAAQSLLLGLTLLAAAGAMFTRSRRAAAPLHAGCGARPGGWPSRDSGWES